MCNWCVTVYVYICVCNNVCRVCVSPYMYMLFVWYYKCGVWTYINIYIYISVKVSKCECMRLRRMCVLQTSVEGMRNTCRDIYFRDARAHIWFSIQGVDSLRGENAPSLYIVRPLCCSVNIKILFSKIPLSLSRLSSSNFRPTLSRERGIASLSKFQPSFLFFSYSNARARKHKLFVLNTCVYMYMSLHIA